MELAEQIGLSRLLDGHVRFACERVKSGAANPTGAAVLAGVRLRAGRAGSAKGAASMVTEAINTATGTGATQHNILVRGESAYCSGKVVAAVVKAGATFSFTITRNPAVDAAI